MIINRLEFIVSLYALIHQGFYFFELGYRQVAVTFRICASNNGHIIAIFCFNIDLVCIYSYIAAILICYIIQIYRSKTVLPLIYLIFSKCLDWACEVDVAWRSVVVKSFARVFERCIEGGLIVVFLFPYLRDVNGRLSSCCWTHNFKITWFLVDCKFVELQLLFLFWRLAVWFKSRNRILILILWCRLQQSP